VKPPTTPEPLLALSEKVLAVPPTVADWSEPLGMKLLSYAGVLTAGLYWVWEPPTALEVAAWLA
jgi:hypothetical protein